ncbi:UdgX family uracil-DNA binding protein [Luteimonas viscosa]|uniref:Type-4 uracil-DNA glycosylase n=1 Tax=Luteimonas viscosa TaxID=1132694 RepID=A0A5D4XSJ9_9GAMM|nr:UdgX family uracil-DNA binding protein [Luteimonas viscosa]
MEPCWDAEAWRTVARAALRAQVPPQDLDWIEGDHAASLLAAPDVVGAPVLVDAPRAPKALFELAPAVLCHRDPQRLGLLYRLLWRTGHGEPALLSNPADADVQRAQALAQAVRRDAHKMKAFVRFRAVPGDEGAFIAWFEPEHRIVDRVAPFFARRFAGMRWAILTPYRSAAWDGATLAFGDGGARSDAPDDDAREELWRTYYAHIFNPARINPRMMRQEMPVKYWKHLPEAQLLPSLLQGAGARVRDMAAREAQAPRRRIPQRHPTQTGGRGELPSGNGRSSGIRERLDSGPGPDPGTGPGQSLDTLRAAARACRACPLWEPATQTVFGEGPADARVLLLGEQPGDSEDLTGRPFTGPAGQLLDRALGELGLDRARFYLTNAVKHFRFERRGKQRLHRNPEAAHVQACRPWLARELEQVRPEVVVCLGATAALALFGRGFRLMEDRGQWRTLRDGTRAFATVHPAWILRQRDPAAREAAYTGFVADLAQLAAPDDSTDPPTPP